jgi:type IV pilus assembly protein PilN
MIRINLLPVKETELAARRSQEIRLVVLVLLLLAIGIVADRVRAGRTIARLDQAAADLESELVVLRERVAEATRLEQQRKDLDTKLKVIAELSQKRVGPAGVLRDLSRATPDRLWLLDVTESAGAATVTGKALDNQTIADFLRALANSPYFKGVDLSETTQDEQAGGIKLKKFLLRANVNYAAKPTDEAEPPPAEGASSPADASKPAAGAPAEKPAGAKGAR